MKKLYSILLAALFSSSVINAQNTIFTENFGRNYTHLESLSNNSSGYNHTGTGDFTHKIVSGQGASGSTCFGQLDSSGVSSVSRDLQLFAGNTYEFKAYVKTIQSMIHVTLRINVGGVDVATSGNTSVNGAWEELSCTYTPSVDEMASLMFVKTGGQLANIDKIKVICTSCTDQNYVFDFNDSKESWIGAGPSLTLGNNSMNIIATGLSAVARSGNLQNGNLNLNTSNYDRARVTFRTPYAAGGAGAGKLYFYSLAGGNTATATFNIPRDASNTTTFQTVEIDLSSIPVSGTFSGPIARLGFRAPWGISSGDTCFLQKIELYNQSSAVSSLTLTGIMDLTIPSSLASISGGAHGKALQLTANQNISDLSVYGIGVANNGGGTDGQEYTFPSISVNAGEHVFLARDTAAMSAYFGSCYSVFDHYLVANSSISQNGDDAIELFFNGNVIETFGDINVDGTGQPWEYLDSWAWKDTAASNIGNWVYGAVNCSDGSTSNATSNCPYPLCNVSPPSSYNVTLKVNTANITVGTNGMYAGGGFLGGSDGLQLTDADGDGTWEGVASVNIGSGPNYYAFFNSPNGSSDWGTKEDLGGLSCADTNNYNDRILASVTADTTMLHCFGSCETDGTCPATVAYNLPFDFETSPVTADFTGFEGGSITVEAVAAPQVTGNTSANLAKIVRNVGQPWAGVFTTVDSSLDFSTNSTITARIWTDAPIGTKIMFKTEEGANAGNNSGEKDVFTTKTGEWEDLVFDFTGVTNANQNKLVLIPANGTMGDGSATSTFYFDDINQAPVVAATFDVTFQVDARNIITKDKGMYLGGGLFGPADAHAMSDADGDGIWTVTVPIVENTTGNYAFLNGPGDGGDWNTKENLAGLPCADTNNYNDRILDSVTAVDTISYCFGTCDASCTPVTRHDVTFNVNMSDQTIGSNGVFLGGGLFGGSNSIALSDPDGDLTYSVIVSVPDGSAGNYAFFNNPGTHFDWGTKEDLGGLSCADTNNYNDRILASVTAATTITYCFATCDASCSVTPPTGISNILNNVLIYPNPANNILNISSSEIIMKVEVLDVVGRKVMSRSLNSYNYQLDISNLNSNVYFINYTINGVITVRKVIVNN
tara:strand:- start:64 stop:3390 length:3327 start_codon:yes stop_codon:yes gene_type:complete